MKWRTNLSNVKYYIAGNKSYSYQDSVLVDTPITLNFSFTADVLDPEAAGLVPYYRSTVGLSDLFFQNLISNNIKFISSSPEPTIGADKDNQYSSWTEVYSRIKDERDIFDTSISVSVPTWRLKFVNLIDRNNINESRRLRQSYGYTPLSGNISARLKQNPTHWSNIFEQYDPNTFIVDSASITEGWQNGELLYAINISWKAYDLANLPIFKENL